MMTGLAPALKSHLEKALQTLPLAGQARKEIDHISPPKIWIGGLPPKKQKDFTEIPCVVVLPSEGHQISNQGWAIISVALICLVFNDEEGDRTGAEGDLMLLISAVTRALLPASQGVPLAEKYILLADGERILPWEKNDEQLKPFLQAVIFSQWQFKGWE